MFLIVISRGFFGVCRLCLIDLERRLITATKELTMDHILWPGDPRDPSFSWPVTRMTRDPWPSPRPWYESITTTHESWWVHDYCLLFTVLMCSGCGLWSVYFYHIYG